MSLPLFVLRILAIVLALGAQSASAQPLDAGIRQLIVSIAPDTVVFERGGQKIVWHIAGPGQP